ncbi:MAG: thioredoxin domain-containing protein [Rhizobiaceae bacterium]|jgi:protein-disulfide isomerase|nr:thioredoxin domain-containing protein [Rhizobiaceae bacterium]
MTRQTLILGSVGLVLVIFAVGAWFNTNTQTADTKPVSPPAKQNSLVRSYSPILGAKDAPVTIVEFFDPACEACRAFHPIVKGILDRYAGKVRVVVRYTPFHGEASLKAIAVLEAARQQNVFLPVMEALLANQPVWASHGSPSPDKILKIAASAGLNIEQAAAQMKSPSSVGIINQDSADVEAVGIRGTPTFFVNGKPLTKFGQRELENMVRMEVEKASATQ